MRDGVSESGGRGMEIGWLGVSSSTENVGQNQDQRAARRFFSDTVVNGVIFGETGPGTALLVETGGGCSRRTVALRRGQR